MHCGEVKGHRRCTEGWQQGHDGYEGRPDDRHRGLTRTAEDGGNDAAEIAQWGAYSDHGVGP